MTIPTLDFSVPPQHLFIFYPLLRRGVGILTEKGRTVLQFLHEDLGLSEATVKNRVQTVFLNGHPADDLHGTSLTDSDVLTLSAAMPGLLGACMRVDSPYAAMRESISQTRQDRQQSRALAGELRFTLKLFNFMASEIGPCVLTRGVYLRQEQLQELMERAAAHDLSKDGVRLKVDGEVLDLEQESPAAVLGSSDTFFVRCLSKG